MIISRTPYRVSLFGGGTDYPSWFKAHGGAVLAGTIDKYCYLTVRYLPPFFEHRIRIVYSKIECCNAVEDIQHPAVRAVLSHLGVDRGIEIHHDGDLPARSGMGSSSSFTVGLLHAVHALRGEMMARKRLADEGIHIEREVLKETVGYQDQILVAHGGFNHITFLPTGEYVVRPVTTTADRIRELSGSLMLLYTGIKRTSSDIAGEYVPELANKKRQLRIMRDMVEEAVQIVTSKGPLDDIGELLHEAWQYKRSLSPSISSPEIDAAYDTARKAGALGGKLCGAGGGGFMLLFAPPERQPDVESALPDMIRVPFHFQPAGSEILYYDEEQEYLASEKARRARPTALFRERRGDGS
jgi:D-glycero-alpha-D-manno-heptose-7-phosphate kinase